jgi:hypothetical protein
MRWFEWMCSFHFVSCASLDEAEGISKSSAPGFGKPIGGLAKNRSKTCQNLKFQNVQPETGLH